ncbi:(d)CMP kinase [Patescibacteria group bacterium]|nr:(d)CMP kinase [Patescibacteria group bacterium]
MPLHIAIDGPVAAGKGTVARLVAQRLGSLYVDTGAMYRVTALIALRNTVPFEDEEKIVELLKQNKIEMRNPNETEQDGRLTTVLLNGEDVSWDIRTEAVGQGSSKVAALVKVREHLVEKQQEIAANQDVVMEGRDITFKVLPDSKLKIYLTASTETRAKRRHYELQTRGQDVTFEDVYKDLQERDDRDMNRAIDPLHVVEGAWVLDSSNLTIEEVVDLIVERAKELKG